MKKITISIALKDGVFAHKFKILNKLGQGEMSVVYRAKHLNLNQEVALKFPRLTSSVGQNAKDYILEGARLLAQLNHPHLVKVYDADVYQKIPYVVMELIRGRDLAKMVEKNPLALRLTLSIAIPIADALSYAHQKGVIHRDIKPINIILTEKHRPILVGFDFASKGLDIGPIRWESLPKEDIEFLAPELIFQGKSHPQVDIWSLGLVMIFLLTGTSPFQGEKKEEVIERLKNPLYKAVDLLPSHIPQKVKKVLEKMTAIHPEERFSSMESVKKELQNLEEELFLRSKNPLIVDTWTSIEDLNRIITTATGETYELIQKKEGGTFGIVYKGRDRKLNRLVALKILRSEFVENREVVLRFQREAQAMSLIRHPNVVEVYTIGEIGGLPFFVMPFVGEEDLEKWIQKESFLPPKKALSIGYYIARGLEAAHQAGVIHRDLKPANILLSQKQMPIITDFGVAYIPCGERLTDGPSIMGTFLYLSPEQAEGLQVDERSDLYSLGVILYEMLTGSPPYVDDNPIHLLRKIIETPPPPLGEWGVSVPPEVEEVVFRLLSKKPENRLASAKQTARIFKKLLASC